MQKHRRKVATKIFYCSIMEKLRRDHGHGSTANQHREHRRRRTGRRRGGGVERRGGRSCGGRRREAAWRTADSGVAASRKRGGASSGRRQEAAWPAATQSGVADGHMLDNGGAMVGCELVFRKRERIRHRERGWARVVLWPPRPGGSISGGRRAFSFF
jgi:hypothetical protein